MAWITPPTWVNGMIVAKSHMDVLNNDLNDLDARSTATAVVDGTQTTNITTLNNAVGIPWSGGTALSRIVAIEGNLGTWSGGTAISRIGALESAVGTAPSRFVRRVNTAGTAISSGWVSIPFATVESGSMSGLTVGVGNDIFTFTEPGVWTVTVNLAIAQTNTPLLGALFMGANVDPYNVGNTRVYAAGNGAGSTAASTTVSLSAELIVPPASSRTCRVSAFATGGTLYTGLLAPSITFSWRPA